MYQFSWYHLSIFLTRLISSLFLVETVKRSDDLSDREIQCDLLGNKWPLDYIQARWVSLSRGSLKSWIRNIYLHPCSIHTGFIKPVGVFSLDLLTPSIATFALLLFFERIVLCHLQTLAGLLIQPGCFSRLANSPAVSYNAALGNGHGKAGDHELHLREI